MGKTLDDFRPLYPAEAGLVAWLQAGNREPFEVSDSLPPDDAPKEVRLRAEFLRYLALGGCEECAPSEKGLRVLGAYIEGDGPQEAETRGLDLEGCVLAGDMDLIACRFPDLLLLRGAQVQNLFLNRSVLMQGMTADGIKALGCVFLRLVVVTGTVRLLDARLGGNLSCESAEMTAGASGIALAADRINVRGSVFLRDAVVSGETRLLGVTLGGDFDCIEAQLTAGESGKALNADGIEAQGNVFLYKVVAKGEVRLWGARLGGGLNCHRAQFTAGKSGNALSADRVEVRGDVMLRGVIATGTVRLLGAKVGGDLDCEGAQLTAGQNGDALNCGGADIAGVFFLRSKDKINGVLDLTAAQIGNICDEVDCWPTEILLDRCRYGAFTGRAPVDAKARLQWLGLQRPEKYGHAFWPQPYEECARALREAGHSGAARTILIEKERLQRAAKRAELRAENKTEQAALLNVWDAVLGATVRYGRAPLLAFGWLLGFWVAGILVFGGAESFGAIKPNLPQVQRAPEWLLCGVAAGEAVTAPSLGRGAVGLLQPLQTQYDCYLSQKEALSYPRFNAWVYSADVLLPVVSLEMQSYWLPNDQSEFGVFARWYLWLQIIAGWALTLLAVAGFSGLIKQDSK